MPDNYIQSQPDVEQALGSQVQQDQRSQNQEKPKKALPQWRVTATFPHLMKSGGAVAVIVEAANWKIAMGRAAREIAKLPEMKKRKISGGSFTMTKLTERVEIKPQAEQAMLPIDTGEHER